MNQGLYRKIFSKRLGAVVAVAETATSKGKRAGQGRRAARAAVALAALGLAGSAAFGQVTTFTAAQDIATVAGTTAPADGAIWTLGASGPFLTSTVTLPASGTLTLNGGGFTLPLTSGGVFGRFSGTVNNNTYTLNLTDITLTQGNSTGAVPTNFGGAITTSNNATRPLTINATGTVALTSNAAAGTNANGGAIYSGGQLTINVDEALTLSGNTATGSGGAIQVFTGGGVSLLGGSASTITLEDNTAAGGAGGAIMVGSTAGGPGLIIDAGTIAITGNHSSALGGAIVAPNTLTIGNAASQVTITGNSAGTGGGALNVVGTSPGTVAKIDGSEITISNNTAGATGGGAVYAPANAGSSLTIGNADSVVTISGNTTTGSGGATNGGTTTINGSNITITGNQAANRGGAFFTANNGYPLVIGDSTSALSISGNSAQFGGVALAFPDSPITINGGGLISGNIVTGNGGAIYALDDVTLNATTADGLTFSGNKPEAITLDNSSNANAVAFNASGGNIVFNDPIDSTAVNLSTVTTTGLNSKAVIFDGTTSGSPVYAATTAASGVFAVQKGAVYGGQAVDFGVTPTTSFTVASGATLAGGGTGTVSADDFSLGGTLDISGSGVTPNNAAVGLPPGAAAANGMSTFNIIAANASLSGGTVEFNVCGDQQIADQLNLTTTAAVTGEATPVFTQVTGCKGAATTGNGIQIVQSASATDNLFTTPSGTTLNIGGIVYTLKQIGNNWYLQSTGAIFVSAAVPVPTQSESALALLALLLAGGAALTLRRKAG